MKATDPHRSHLGAVCRQAARWCLWAAVGWLPVVQAQPTDSAPKAHTAPTSAPITVPTAAPTTAAVPAPSTAPVGATPAGVPGAPASLDGVWAALRKAGVQPTEVALLAHPLTEGAPVLVAHNEQLPMTMASTTKVMTTLAGLQLLPSTFRWNTRAWLGGKITDATLQGDLILVGGGDATLNSKTLSQWFARLHKKGLTHIQGRIVLDQSMFRLSAQDHVNTPVPEAGNPHHAWPDAFVLDESRFDVHLSVGGEGTLQARFDPPLAQVELVNQVITSGACRAQARFEAVESPAAPVAPAVKPALAAAPAPTPTPTPSLETATTPDAAPTPAEPSPVVARVVISGHWNPRCKATLALDAAPGRALSSAVVAGAWAATGGTLSGAVVHREPARAAPKTQRTRKVSSPYPGKPWDTWASAPLPELVQSINKTSNNLMARSLLLSIAPGFSPTTSTLQLARQRMTQWFGQIGLAQAAPHIDNGSGLAHNEKASAHQMVQLLRQAWAAPKVQKVFLASLPIAGADGTLGNRFKNSTAQRQAFLKTGTLTGVRSLAGYVRGKSGQMIAVTVIVNSPNATAAVPAMDRFIEWVVNNG